MPERAYDVLIVGGGPAGSSCAWKLRVGGMRVMLLDKKPFPRVKPCAGWITPQVVQTLRLDLDRYRQGRVWQPITGFRCGTISGGKTECRYDEPVSFGIRRCEFDTFLLDRAGVPCRLGEGVESIERKDHRWLINGRYTAAMLVGAGGHFCPVARRLGARSHSPAGVVFAQEVEFRPNRGQPVGAVEPHTPELYFCDDLLGYGWCFRKGDYLNIGLGRTDSRGLSGRVEEFVAFLREQGRVHCEIPDRFHGHAYQLYERAVPKLVASGAVLIGDAAGLAYARSGEGIRPAVESGILAAQAILSAQGAYEPETLVDYELQLVRRLGRPQGGTAAGFLPAGWLHHLSARLLATRWFSRHVVLDDWFLHRKQPAMA